MQIKKKIIHYKLSSFLLIIGFIVSFICYVNCVNLYHLKVTKKKEQTKYKYINELILTCSNQTKERLSMESVFENLGGNMIAKDLEMYRNAVEAMGVADIIVNQTESLQYPIWEGVLPENDEEILCPTVILGREHKKDTIIYDDTYYYEIEGSLFQVCAFIGSDSSDLFDYNVILYYNGMPEDLKRKINLGENLQILLGSNSEDTYSIYKTMQERAEMLDSQIIIMALAEEHLLMEQNIGGNINYYFIIMLFCIVNSIIVSEYWIKGRYREIAIRKLLGYSDVKVFLLLFGDMIKNVLCSVIFAVIMQGILYLSFRDYIKLYASQYGYYLTYGIVFVVVLSMIMLIYPFFLLRKENVLKKVISN